MSGRREVAIALGAYGCYLGARRLVWTDAGRARARRNARRVLSAEGRAGLDIERRAQQLAMRWPRLATALSAGYAAGNVSLSVGWLMLLRRQGAECFERERRAAVAAFLGALPVFALFPTAPPRMMDGYVDMLGEQGIDLDDPTLVRFYNPIAAMPSYHVAFAVVSGIGLAHRSRSTWGRAWWLSYPAAVAAIVLATGNHYAADVAAGAALGLAARAVTR